MGGIGNQGDIIASYSYDLAFYYEMFGSRYIVLDSHCVVKGKTCL